MDEQQSTGDTASTNHNDDTHTDAMAESVDPPAPSLAQSRRRWLTGAGMLAGGQVIALAVGGIASIVLARTLKPAGFGTYSVLSVVVSLAALIAAFGLDIHLMTELRAQDSDLHPYGSAFRLSFEVTEGLCLAGLVLVIALTRGVTQAAALFAIAELVLTPFLLARSVLLVRMQQGRVAALGVANRLVLLVGVLLIAALRPPPVLVWMMAVSAAAVGAEAVLLFVLVGPPVGWRHRLRSRRRQLLVACWPLVASGIAVAAYGRIDQLLVAAFNGRSEVGKYAVAVSLATLLNLVSAVVYTTTLPGLVEVCATGDEHSARQAVKDMGLLMFLPGGLGVAVIAGAGVWIIQLLFGSLYAHDASLVAILAFAEVWVFVGTAITAILIAVDRRRALLGGTVCGVVVDVTLCLLFLPRYGIIAAAWASLVSYAVAALVAVMVVPAARRLARPLIAVTIEVTIAAAVGGIAGMATSHLVPAILASSLAYAAISAVLFRGEVIRVWRHFARERFRLRA
jgi:PST family polysaccharide transporter